MKKRQAPSTRSRRREKAEVPDPPDRSASLLRRQRGLNFGAWCFSGVWCLVLGACISLHAQPTPHIGYVYPAGGERGDTYFVTVGGQFLDGATNVSISGDGVKATVVEFNKPMPQGQFNQLRDKLRELQDRKQAARREPNSTNVWTAADEKEMTTIREKMLKNPPNRQGNPAIAETVTLKFVMATNALAGAREIRLGTPNGFSNPLAFHVGELREYSAPAAKAPNPEVDRFRERLGKPVANEPADFALRVSLPAVVNGQIMPGEVDHVRFTARKGQRIVAEAKARELIPYLADAVPGWFQATLALFDAKGRELAYADDFRFNPDPVLLCEIPKDGDYTLEIKDAIYRGREDFVYRVTIGELPFVTSVFPLGGPMDQATEVEFSGYNLAASNRTQTVKFTETGIHQLAVTSGGHISNPTLFAVDSLPEALEQEPNSTLATAQRVKLPLIINGRIGAPGDVDVFCFEGQAGSQVVAEVTARRLNSPLDSQLQLTDGSGKQIAFNDDSDNKAAGLETHHADSYLRAMLPTNRTFYLHLRDTQQQGGAEFSYRLRLSAPQPDFELRVVPSSLVARAGASVPLTVYALRKDGFTNAISLGLLNPPTGFKVNGASVPADQEKVRLTLSVPATPPPEPISLALEGRARLDGQPIVHPAVPADDLMQAFIYRHLVPAQELKVTVLGRSQQRTPPRILSETPVKIPIGGTARVKIGAPGVFVDRFELELNEPPEGISIRKVSPSRDGAEIELAADLTKAKPGQRGNLIVSAYAARPTAPNKPKAAGNLRRAPVATLPAIPFEIVSPP